MEKQIDHSKAKLALAIFTSPGAAFEEINRRKLLGTALAISAATGTLSAVPPLISCLTSERLQWLLTAQYNPIIWLGLTCLYVAAMQRLLKWIGTQAEFVSLFTLVGWAQLSLFFAQICSILLAVGGLTRNTSMASAGGSGLLLFMMWYVLLMGWAIHVLLKAPKARGILTYIIVHMAIWIGMSQTYATTRTSGFEGASQGLVSAVLTLANADRLPWAGAGVVGLVLGALALTRHFEWPVAKARLAAAGAALAGILVFSAYAFALHQAGYYTTLRRGHVNTLNQNYATAAASLESFAPKMRDSGRLLKDIGDIHFLAGNDKDAIRKYKACITAMKAQKPGDMNKWLAQAHDGIGAVYDQQGKYEEAIAEFKKAAKVWPEFREPWVRMGVTHNRAGKYDKALEAANHAIEKLDSEAAVAWVALAQASIRTGNTVQAKAAITIVTERNEKLASRVGKTPAEWKYAVDRLTREDLKYPLEREPAPPPKKPAPKQKPGAK